LVLETTPYIWMLCVGRVVLEEFLCFIKCAWTASLTTIQPEANFAQISEALLCITSVLFNNIVSNCRLPIVGLRIALNAPIIKNGLKKMKNVAAKVWLEVGS
jgi:hypothetical protein